MPVFTDLLKPLALDVSRFVLDTLFPKRCVPCGTEGSFLCPECARKLVRLERQRCAVCRKPSVSGLTHPHCATPFAPDGLFCLFDYRDRNVSELIIQGKYYFLKDIFTLLSEDLARAAERALPDVLAEADALVPVPLYKRRLRWRGFNQSEVLVKNLAKAWDLSVTKPLTRVRSTKTQKDLRLTERLKNIRGVFTATADVKNKRLILVDDVTTTGATLLEASKVLKRSGAASVWCLALAREG